MSEQQYDTAFFFYRKALEATPELRGIHVAISRIYQIKGNEDWAKIEQEKELKQGIPDCEKEKEVCSYLQGEFHDLLKIVHSKKSPEAYYWQSQAFNQLALAALSQLAKLPSSVEVHSLRAEVNRNLGRHWDSVAELEKALQLEPENIYLKQELVISKYLNRDYDGSRSLAFDLMKVLPPSAQLNFIVGDGYLYQQSVEQAIPYLEKAVKLQPDYLAAHSSLGRAYMTIGNAESAIPHLHQAMSLDENGDLHYQLARAYQRMGDREKAREAMQKYQELRNSSRIEERELQETVKITPP
jgi:tetratricopeptide (TPR) repeat protein